MADSSQGFPESSSSCGETFTSHPAWTFEMTFLTGNTEHQRVHGRLVSVKCTLVIKRAHFTRAPGCLPRNAFKITIPKWLGVNWLELMAILMASLSSQWVELLATSHRGSQFISHVCPVPEVQSRDERLGENSPSSWDTSLRKCAYGWHYPTSVYSRWLRLALWSVTTSSGYNFPWYCLHGYPKEPIHVTVLDSVMLLHLFICHPFIHGYSHLFNTNLWSFFDVPGLLWIWMFVWL